MDFEISGQKNSDGTPVIIGRPVSLKVSEASILGKIFVVAGYEIKPNKEYMPQSLIGKTVQVIIADTWTKPKIGKPELVSEIKEIMKHNVKGDKK